MIIGPKITHVPFFNKEHEDYELYTSMGSYTLDADQYFLGRDFENYLNHWGIPEFEFYAFFDVLVAPAFIFKKLQDSKFGYEQGFVDVFFEIFKTEAEYEKILFDKKNDFIDKVDSETVLESKSSILEELEFLKTEVVKTQNALQSSLIEIKKKNWIYISLNVCQELKKHIENLLVKINLIPDEIIRYNYYSKNNHKSWEKNPLAFFINFLFEDGDKFLRKDWNEYTFFYNDNSIGFETYKKDRLYQEAEISSNRINKLLSGVNDKQSEINGICEKLNLLYNQSKFKKWSNEQLITYARIILRLIETHKDLKVNLQFNLKFPLDDFFYGPYSEPKFLESILAHTIKDVERNSVIPFSVMIRSYQSRPMNSDELWLFIIEDFDALPSIKINWESGPFYYLLVRIIHRKQNFNIKKLEDSKKVKTKNGLLFTSSAFRKYISEYVGIKLKDIKKGIFNPEKEPLGYMPSIDALFR